jgi:hypothetical protein
MGKYLLWVARETGFGKEKGKMGHMDGGISGVRESSLMSRIPGSNPTRKSNEACQK